MQATLELMKQTVRRPLNEARNWFVNLALPSLVSSEPGACERKRIHEGLELSFWDRWDVHGTDAMTIGELLVHFEERYKLRIYSILCGVRPVFLSTMPAYRNRLEQPVCQHLGAAASKSDPPAATVANHAAYADLQVSFLPLSDDSESEPFAGPSIRFYYWRRTRAFCALSYTAHSCVLTHIWWCTFLLYLNLPINISALPINNVQISVLVRFMCTVYCTICWMYNKFIPGYCIRVCIQYCTVRVSRVIVHTVFTRILSNYTRLTLLIIMSILNFPTREKRVSNEYGDLPSCWKWSEFYFHSCFATWGVQNKIL